MSIALVFPGQGSQFPGMAKDLYENNDFVKDLFKKSEKILNFDIKETMFNGNEEDLKKTNITQSAIFIHSIAHYHSLSIKPNFSAVSGHSLGEFTALVIAEVFSFEVGLDLVKIRAASMQEACNKSKSIMAAVLGLEDEKLIEICKNNNDVFPANFNCPGQLVISGSIDGIERISEVLKQAGAKRIIPLKVDGAFHSKYMEPAKLELSKAINKAEFKTPKVDVYQNLTGKKEKDPVKIKENLISQLTNPVLWTQTINNMYKDGINTFMEIGPGKVLRGLISKIEPKAIILNN